MDPLLRSQRVPDLISGWDHSYLEPNDVPVGFKNKGIYCYRNVVVQLLLHTPILINWTDDYINLEDPGHRSTIACFPLPKRPCIYCAFHDLEEAYYFGERREENWEDVVCKEELALFWRKLKRGSWRDVDHNQQHDAREFLEAIIRQLYNETQELWLPKLDKMFQLTTLKHFKCQTCGVSTTSQPDRQYVLAASYPRDDPSIASAIASGFGDQSLTKACENCKSNANHLFHERIHDLPEVLLIQINSFTEQGERSSSKIDLEEVLTIPANIRGDNKGEAEYELYSVIFHRGTVRAGHYVIAVKVPSGEWVLLNDDYARSGHIELKDVLRNKVRPRGAHPYMFAYRRLPLGQTRSSQVSSDERPSPAQQPSIRLEARTPSPAQQLSSGSEARAPSPAQQPSIRSEARISPPAQELDSLFEARTPSPAQQLSSGSEARAPSPAQQPGNNSEASIRSPEKITQSHSPEARTSLSPSSSSRPSSHNTSSPGQSQGKGGVKMDGTIHLDGRDIEWTIQQQLVLPPGAGNLVALKARARTQRATVHIKLTSADDGEVLEGTATISLNPGNKKSKRSSGGSSAIPSGNGSRPQGIEKNTQESGPVRRSQRIRSRR